MGQPGRDRRRHDGEEGDGHGGPEPGEHEDGHRDADAQGDRRDEGCAHPVTDGREGRDGDVVVTGGEAEGGGDLLEGDERGDAEGEALDDGEGDEAHRASGAGQSHADEQDAGHQPHDEHAVGAVGRDDRHEDDRHRPGGAGDLDVAAPEERGDDAGDDRGDEAGRRAEPRGDAEGQGEGEGDDPDRHPGDEVTTRGAQHGAQVAAPGPDGVEPRPERAKGRARRWTSRCRGVGAGRHARVMSSTRPPWSAALVRRMARALARRSRTSGTAME